MNTGGHVDLPGAPPDEGGEYRPVRPAKRNLGLVRRSTATSCCKLVSSLCRILEPHRLRITAGHWLRPTSGTPHLRLYEAIGRVHPQVLGRTLPLNGAAVCGAALANLDLPVAMLRGFALLARAAGLLGQVAEEHRRGAGSLMSGCPSDVQLFWCAKDPSPDRRLVVGIKFDGWKCD